MNKIIYSSPMLSLAMASTFFLFPVAQANQLDIEQLDRNSDGHISIKEAVVDPKLLESFSRIDTDGNGMLSATELANRPPKGSRNRVKS